jgi:hypothetical protein
MGFFSELKKKPQVIDKGMNERRPVMSVVIEAEHIEFGPFVVEGTPRKLESGRDRIRIFGKFVQYKIDNTHVRRVGGEAFLDIRVEPLYDEEDSNYTQYPDAFGALKFNTDEITGPRAQITVGRKVFREIEAEFRWDNHACIELLVLESERARGDQYLGVSQHAYEIVKFSILPAGSYP